MSTAPAPHRNVFPAIFLIGMGVIALLNFWWPGIMFALGIALLAQDYAERNTIDINSSRVRGAAVIILIGLVGLININIPWGSLWPLVLIGIGVYLIARQYLMGDKTKSQ